MLLQQHRNPRTVCWAQIASFPSFSALLNTPANCLHLVKRPACCAGIAQAHLVKCPEYCAGVAQAAWEDQEAQLTAGLLAHAAPAGDDQVGAPTLSAQGPGSSTGSLLALYNSAAWEVLHEVVLPVVILLLGVGFSVAALWVALAAFVVPSS